MGRKPHKRQLYVYMNGRQVGTLTRELGDLQFNYHAQWLAWEYARPISLSIPLSEQPYGGEPVYYFFDNLLPDNESIRKRIQQQFNAKTNHCFDLLSYIGADCVGALQLLTTPHPMDIRQIQADPIDDIAIASLLKHYHRSPLGMNRDTDFRISLAGAQEKTALLWYKNQWQQPKGATPTTHIVKLPIGYIEHANMDLSDSVENEWLCLQLLSGFGLPVNSATITHFGDIKTLVVERFDRRWMDNNRWLLRLPQEDLCQALGVSSALKYESDGGPGIASIMQVLLGAYTAKADRKQFMQSVFLFWVLGAIDGHAKNFSIQLETGGRYQLTPIYDVISAYPLVTQHQLQSQQLKMAMALKGKNRHYQWDTLRPRHWLSMAKLCDFPTTAMQAIITETCDTLEEVITQVSHQLPSHFPVAIAESIFAGMRRSKNCCIT